MGDGDVLLSLAVITGVSIISTLLLYLIDRIIWRRFKAPENKIPGYNTSYKRYE